MQKIKDKKYRIDLGKKIKITKALKALRKFI